MPGELPDGTRDRRAFRSGPTRATRSAAHVTSATWPGAPGRHRQPAPPGSATRGRPDLDVADLRGNVDTRLRRLAEGRYDAVVLAAAGLMRLGRADEGSPIDESTPAAGQGCLALEARDGR